MRIKRRDQTCTSEGSSCRCQDPSASPGGINRREFVKTVALGAATTVVPGWVAGPFPASSGPGEIPLEKNLNPEWLRSLTLRGTPAVYRGGELRTIGMPVGGICAGTLYLGGDGKLWLWDIFNRNSAGIMDRTVEYRGAKIHPTEGAAYVDPPGQICPLEQGFALKITQKGRQWLRTLDGKGFPGVSFRGEYPIGTVTYASDDLPVSAVLEAFSPFLPPDPLGSDLPATLLNFTLKNNSTDVCEATIAGWLENAVCISSGTPDFIERQNSVETRSSMTLLSMSASRIADGPGAARRSDILFEDFQKETYEGWEVRGTAFGPGPIEKLKMPSYQGDVGSDGKRVVNSHNVRSGEDVTSGDAHTGRLRSRPFSIERDYIHFFIGGGNHPAKTCINLLLEGEIVLSATGHDANRMRREKFDVRSYQGRTGRLEIVDEETGPWGNIGIAEIIFSDRTVPPTLRAEDQADHGTMCLALRGTLEGDRGIASLPEGAIPEAVFSAPGITGRGEAVKPFGRPHIGALARSLTLKPGEEAAVTFVLSWYFPNQTLKDGGRFYATRFASAAEVAEHVVGNIGELTRRTRLWRDTWYDSTLPYWFLDRTFANTSILATSTCHWLGTGRFYAWEGVGCCDGTCTHVWHYAQAVARVFPALERDLRERTDLGLAFDAGTGVINFRGEHAGLAVDGQAGSILRAYREHQMSADDRFLQRNWVKIRKALLCLIGVDGNDDGVLEGAQQNTLDAAWYGKSPWLSSLYHAALRAGEEMAIETGDSEFASRCRTLFERGVKNLDEATWRENFRYYVQVPDQANPGAVGSYNGCHIDQVLGQSWAHQVGLGYVMHPEHSKAALRSLWDYNFTPDVGPYREAHRAGRWYAMPGEGGTLMLTHPFGDERKFRGESDAWTAGYFNECMSGFEYQVAGHMIWEGMVTEGLAVARMIHDRYHASRRNPWNEIECSDHYARAMASYGVFLAACGFRYHGPKAHMEFSPRLTPEDFRAPFTAAEGWGTISQRRAGSVQTEAIELRHGRLVLRSLAFTIAEGARVRGVDVKLGGRKLPCTYRVSDTAISVTLSSQAIIDNNERMEVTIS